MAQLTRDLYVPLIDTTKGKTDGTYTWVPIDKSTQFELSYNPSTDTKSYICYKSDYTVVTSYAPELPEEIVLDKDNPLYAFMDEFLNSFPIGSDAEIPFLFVRPDLSTGAATKGLMWKHAVVTGDTLNTVDGVLSFTIALNGDPVEGTVSGLGTSKVTFTPKSSSSQSASGGKAGTQSAKSAKAVKE